MKGAGVAFALDRIRQAFREIHGDVRDKTQVEADRQLLVEIASDEQTTEVEQIQETRSELDTSVTRTKKIANVLIQSALRGSHVRGHRILRRDSHYCYEIEVPIENASELFTQALRQLEEE